MQILEQGRYFNFRMAKTSSSREGVCRGYFSSNDRYCTLENGEGKSYQCCPIQSTIKQTKLPPNSVDAALIVDAYHEFSHPLEMATSILNSLKPGGKLILIEYRMEDPTCAYQIVSKMTEKQAKAEMKNAGFKMGKP